MYDNAYFISCNSQTTEEKIKDIRKKYGIIESSINENKTRKQFLNIAALREIIW